MQLPAQFGKFHLLERLAVGGMAEVFLAKAFGAAGFERLLVIKKILPHMSEDEEFIAMFIDEARIASTLSHSNIIQIHELGKEEGDYYIAMEFCLGKDLSRVQEKLQQRKTAMKIPMAVLIASRICEGLEYAHRKADAQGRSLNIIHRDVSPGNILISYDGDVKIIDFGIAKATNRMGRTTAGTLKGKFGYMSPEQVRGLPLDHRSDIFSVGILLYEMLTGERLFGAESDFGTLEKVRNATVVPPTVYNTKVPKALEQVVLRALARQPQERYEWASDMQEDLVRFLMVEGSLTTSKSLSAFMRELFAREITKENEKLARYRQRGYPGVDAGAAREEGEEGEERVERRDREERPPPPSPPTQAKAPEEEARPTPPSMAALAAQPTQILTPEKAAALDDLPMPAKPAWPSRGKPSPAELSAAKSTVILEDAVSSVTVDESQAREATDEGLPDMSDEPAGDLPPWERDSAVEARPPAAEGEEEEEEEEELEDGEAAGTLDTDRSQPGRDGKRKPTGTEFVGRKKLPDEPREAVRPARPKRKPAPVELAADVVRRKRRSQALPLVATFVLGIGLAATAGYFMFRGESGPPKGKAGEMEPIAAPDKPVEPDKPAPPESEADAGVAAAAPGEGPVPGQDAGVGAQAGADAKQEFVAMDIRPEPAKPEVAPEPEPVKPEPVKPEPAKPEPAKPEPVKPEPAKPEPAKPEPAKPEPIKAEPVKPKPEHIKPKPEPVKPKPPPEKPVAVATKGLRLEIKSTPPGAEVLLNGKPSGTTPTSVSGLDPGKNYMVILRKEGYKKAFQGVKPGAGKGVVVVQVTLEAEGGGGAKPAAGGGAGFLVANTKPWAKVSVDGKDTGKWTPLVGANKLSIPAGKHRLTFTTKEGKTLTVNVDVKPGETVKVIQDIN